MSATYTILTHDNCNATHIYGYSTLWKIDTTVNRKKNNSKNNTGNLKLYQIVGTLTWPREAFPGFLLKRIPINILIQVLIKILIKIQMVVP